MALFAGCQKVGIKTYLNNGSLERTMQKLEEKKIDTRYVASLEQIAKNCDIIVLCIKPMHLAEVAAQLDQLLNKDHILISCLAKTTITELEELFPNAEPMVVKVMTTLGVFNCQGVSAYQLPFFASEALKNVVVKFLTLLSGKNCVFEIDDKAEMNLFTIYVGCMPGIIAFWLDLYIGTLQYVEILRRKSKVLEWFTQSLPTQLRAIADLLEDAGSAENLFTKVATKGGVTDAMTTYFNGRGIQEMVHECSRWITTHEAQRNKRLPRSGGREYTSACF
jgi:pyrroline-5-carboxylate reductase